MAKMVGLSRPVKLEWLNKTVELLIEGKKTPEIKDELNEYLAFEIKSQINLRKTREILMTIWVNIPDEILSIRQQALDAYQNKNGRVAAHWSMLLVAYPIFADVCSLIGKLTSIQDTFAPAWLKDRLFETWGERSTLFYSVNRILQTLKSLGAIESVEPGVYRIKKQAITSQKVILALLSAVLFLKERSHYEIPELAYIPKLFPFEFDVSPEWLYQAREFEFTHIAGRTVLVAE